MHYLVIFLLVPTLYYTLLNSIFWRYCIPINILEVCCGFAIRLHQHQPTNRYQAHASLNRWNARSVNRLTQNRCQLNLFTLFPIAQIWGIQLTIMLHIYGCKYAGWRLFPGRPVIFMIGAHPPARLSTGYQYASHQQAKPRTSLISLSYLCH